MAAKGEGKAYKWILAHVGYSGNDCLTWPFARDKHGRGMLGYNGIHDWAHRVMCRLAKGEPPTPKHTAAHSCGKGHEGCINPRHLDWKTQAENLEDCRAHGTLVRHRGGNKRRLSPEQIQAIKDARGTATQGTLAARYSVSEGTISDIWHGRSHSRPSKIPHWTDEELRKLREAIDMGKSLREMAAYIGTKNKSSTTMKVYRLGLKSKWVAPERRS
jgi:hypothetical protein